MLFEDKMLKMAKSALKTHTLDLFIAKRLQGIIKQIKKSQDQLIDYYSIRYLKGIELDKRLWRLTTYKQSGQTKQQSTEASNAKKVKSSFKKRKSIMLLFGDQTAARKVIYEQKDECEEDSVKSSENSEENMPLRKARNICRALD